MGFERVGAKKLIESIRTGIRSKKRYYVCYVDFEKAFDTLDRQLLFTKLQRNGLPVHFTKVLYNLYAQNNIQVCSDGYLSTKISQTIGVPQGDKLSPLLFALFLADLSAELKSIGCFTIFYADDLAIGSTELDSVKNARFVLKKYCQRNSLRVNIGKTKVVKHRIGGKLARTDQLFFNNTEIEFKDSFEYLGIVLSTKLTGSKHLEHLKKKAYAASCSIQSKVQLRKICLKSSVRLYESVIFSSASYAIDVFSDVLSQKERDEHFTKVAGFYFKKWIGISIYSRTHKILHFLSNNDFLGLQNCSPAHRRERGIFYSNGFHHVLCHKERCYESADDETCSCKYCGCVIISDLHLDTCVGFSQQRTIQQKVREIYRLTLDP